MDLGQTNFILNGVHLELMEFHAEYWKKVAQMYWNN